MKAFFIPAGILAVILGFSLWTGRYVERQTSQWIELLEAADLPAQEENWRQAEDNLRLAYDGWNSSQTFFHTIMDHDALDDAEELFAGAFAVCQEADGADFHMLLAQLAKQLELLAETQSVSIKNVL